VCKEDLGPQNPRQLCRKSYCPEQFLELDLELDSDNQLSRDREQQSQSNVSPPLNDDLMCESCSQSVKSSQSSLTPTSSNSVPFQDQDQPTQIVNLNTNNNALSENPPENVELKTKKYPINDIRSFLAINKK
jgi:hypothetical protein